MEKPGIGISSCLLGEKVRYDGGHKLSYYLKSTLGQIVRWIPVCPEVGCGLPVPREAMKLVEDPSYPRLVSEDRSVDHTEKMCGWIVKELQKLEKEDLSGFIFKSRSPSSGLLNVRVYSTGGRSYRMGMGLFALAFTKRFQAIPVEDDERLHAPGIMENFIERIFVFKKWKHILNRGKDRDNLLSFHEEHERLIASHSQKHLRKLEGLVIGSRQGPWERLYERYFILLMDALRLRTEKQGWVKIFNGGLND